MCVHMYVHVCALHCAELFSTKRHVIHCVLLISILLQTICQVYSTSVTRCLLHWMCCWIWDAISARGNQSQIVHMPWLRCHSSWRYTRLDQSRVELHWKKGVWWLLCFWSTDWSSMGRGSVWDLWCCSCVRKWRWQCQKLHASYKRTGMTKFSN